MDMRYAMEMSASTMSLIKKKPDGAIVRLLGENTKASIRAAIDAAHNPTPAPAVQSDAPSDALEQFYSPEQIGKVLGLHPKTVKRLMQHETEGKLIIGNRISTRHTRAKTMERYSASAVQRLKTRLGRGEDPRFQASLRN